MNEYNFDPMTGEPIRKEPLAEAPAEQPAAEQPAAEQPAAEQPVAEQPAAEQPAAEQPAETETVFNEAVFSRYETEEEPPAPKREAKPLTWKVLIPVVAGAAVLSLVLGLVGGFVGARMVQKNTVPTDAVVIYKTTKLKDENGNTAKEALSVPQVAELVKNSVVEITTEQIVTGSFMMQYVSEGAGSGVIISADGYIVTNHHVIDGATNIKVRLADGTEYTAKTVGTDAKSDLAVIKVEAAGLTPAAYGSSAELAVGETVVAVGNPLGELGGTVTSGIISALDREITIENTKMRLLQTDTAINPGNSGGGMFNTSGQLVGIVNAKNAGAEIEGLGFAIPIDTASKVVEDLLKVGYVTGRVAPGFNFLEVLDARTAALYRVNELGLYVQSVQKDSDAEKAGFKMADYVVSIDGVKVSTEAEATAIIDAKSVGDTLTLVIKRQGQEQTLTMTLSEYVPSAMEPTQPQQQPQLQQPGFSFGDLFGF